MTTTAQETAPRSTGYLAPHLNPPEWAGPVDALSPGWGSSEHLAIDPHRGCVPGGDKPGGWGLSPSPAGSWGGQWAGPFLGAVSIPRPSRTLH